MRKCKLKELIEVTRGASLSGEYYSTEGELIRLTLGNFDYENGGFKVNTSKDDIYFTGEVKEEFILNEGDIITPLTEQAIGLLGTTARIPVSGRYIQSQDVALVRCNDELDPAYCYYLLPSDVVKKQLSAGAQQTSIRHTSPDKIKDCWVFVLEKDEQKKVASFLDIIENKIALKRRMNATLEKMAKQVYDYWFVQFDFPNHEGKPYKSSGGKMIYSDVLKREIPEGWKVSPIFDALDITYGYPFSTDSFVEYETDKPLIRIRDILDGTISAYSTEDVDEKYRLNKGDVVVGMDGNFHINFWHDDKTYLNQRCVRLRSKLDSSISAIQILYSIKPYIKAKEATVKGSTVGHLSDKDMKELMILESPNKELRKTLDSFLNKILLNRNEIIKLTNLRKYLMPLLMNEQAKIGL